MIRHFTLGPAKHEEAAIYAVNQRISNVCRIVRVAKQRSNPWYQLGQNTFCPRHHNMGLPKRSPWKEAVMLRFILIVIILVGYLILSIPLLLIEWIIGKFNTRAKDISSLRIVQAVFRLMIFIAGVKITVIGEENVPADQAVLYIGNHRSYFDILLTYSRCPNLTGFVAKRDEESTSSEFLDDVSALSVSGS